MKNINSKNLYLGLAVLCALVFAVWGFSTLNQSARMQDLADSNPATSKTTTGSKSTTKVTASPTPTFTNILPKAGNYMCTYNVIASGIKNINTLYLADGKMRGEFRSTNAQGISLANIMVYDGRYLYSWVEGQSNGTVSEPKSISDLPAIIPRDIVTSRSLGSGLNNASWECHAWSKDSTMLMKPSYLRV
jgi:hypothetical protein